MIRGRKPTPAAVKRRQGNPGKRRLNKKEPRLQSRIPSCPKHLQGEARREWNRSAGLLRRLGVITELDRAVLAAYCTAYADYVEAVEHLNKTGAVKRSKKGGEYQNLWVPIKKRSMDQMVKFGSELGLTPSSRSRVQVGDLDTSEEKEKRLFPHGNKGAGK
jgi:P27 family predicted phage terminase small subunit